CLFFFSSRRRHTRFSRDWSSDVCSSDLDLVRFTQLTILALQGLDAVPLLSRLTGSLAVVGLVLAHPAMQRLWDTANFGCNGLDGCPLGGVVLQVLPTHAHSTLAGFRGGGVGFLHASASHELRPPRNPV